MRIVLFTLAMLCGSALAETSLTYAQFVTRADALHEGMTRDEIVAQLGEPDQESGAFLGYSLAKFVKSLPVGTQAYYGAQIDLKDGRMSGQVKWAWIDTTGPAPRNRR